MREFCFELCCLILTCLKLCQAQPWSIEGGGAEVNEVADCAAIVANRKHCPSNVVAHGGQRPPRRSRKAALGSLLWRYAIRHSQLSRRQAKTIEVVRSGRMIAVASTRQRIHLWRCPAKQGAERRKVRQGVADFLSLNCPQAVAS